MGKFKDTLSCVFQENAGYVYHGSSATDLGTADTALVYMKGRGIVMREPSTSWPWTPRP